MCIGRLRSRLGLQLGSQLGSRRRDHRSSTSRGGATPVMIKLGRPGFVWVGVKPWRMLAVRVIHLGYQRGGSGLEWVIPAARAARGGEHAGVRAFWAQWRPKRYGLRCNMTKEGRGSSPRARGGRSCSGGKKPTTTGGGWIGLSRTARCGAPPGLLAHQINTCRSCEGVEGISAAKGPTTASNWRGGADHRC
jgi:hypothetical protein